MVVDTSIDRLVVWKTRRMRIVPAATAATLGGLAAVHVAWGVGSSFPFADRDELADAVVGSEVMPGPAESFAVAALLGLATAVVIDVLPMSHGVRRSSVAGLVAVLAVRGGLGLAGRTDILVPGSTGHRFRRLDRRWYSPLCLVVAAGATASLR